MSASLEIRLLGPFEGLVGGRPAEVTGPKRHALLALLALRGGRMVPVEVLVDALWGPEVPVAPRNAVQHHISRLRAALGASGAAAGGVLGLLLLEPVLFAAVGAVAGAAGAGLSALGLNQWFLRQLDETLEPGRAALFVVVSDADPEPAIQALAPLAPRVLRTTLPADAERRLLAALTDTAPQAGSASPSPPASD